MHAICVKIYKTFKFVNFSTNLRAIVLPLQIRMVINGVIQDLQAGSSGFSKLTATWCVYNSTIICSLQLMDGWS